MIDNISDNQTDADYNDYNDDFEDYESDFEDVSNADDRNQLQQKSDELLYRKIDDIRLAYDIDLYENNNYENS
jgi:hypothetical protein